MSSWCLSIIVELLCLFLWYMATATGKVLVFLND